MEVGNFRLKLDKFSDVPIRRATPAELMVLRRAHEINVGGDPISDVEVCRDIEQSDRDEKSRLLRKYPRLKVRPPGADKDVGVVELLFPGESPRLPQSFQETGVETKKGELRGLETYAPRPEKDEKDEIDKQIDDEFETTLKK